MSQGKHNAIQCWSSHPFDEGKLYIPHDFYGKFQCQNVSNYISLYHIHPYVRSPVDWHDDIFFPRLLGWSCQLQKIRRRCPSLTMDRQLVETCWNFQAKEKAKNVVAELTWPEIDAFLRGLEWVDWCWCFLESMYECVRFMTHVRDDAPSCSLCRSPTWLR